MDKFLIWWIIGFIFSILCIIIFWGFIGWVIIKLLAFIGAI